MRAHGAESGDGDLSMGVSVLGAAPRPMVSRVIPSVPAVAPVGERHRSTGTGHCPDGRRIAPRVPATAPMGRGIAPVVPVISPMGRYVAPVVPAISPMGRCVAPVVPAISPMGRGILPRARVTAPSGRDFVSQLRTPGPAERRIIPRDPATGHADTSTAPCERCRSWTSSRGARRGAGASREDGRASPILHGRVPPVGGPAAPGRASNGDKPPPDELCVRG